MIKVHTMNQTSQSSFENKIIKWLSFQDANNFCKRTQKIGKASQEQKEKVWSEIIWINQLKNIYA